MSTSVFENMSVRSLVTAVLCLLTFFTIGVSGLNSESTGLTLADIPACGLRCLITYVPASGCLPTDMDCICENAQLTRSTADCMLDNCTMQESLDTSRVQASLCNFSNESKTREVILYTSIVYSIAFVAVALRVVGKILSKRLSWDDLAVVGALAVVTITLGIVLEMASLGFGEHMWNLEDGQLRKILLRLYVSWSIYIIVLCLIKVSLVLFYLQIFTTPLFKKVAYIVLGYIVINSLAVLLVAIFPCRPMASWWNRDIKHGKCVNIQASAYWTSACALIQDVILLVLPMIFLRNLQMKRYRKIAVGFMFAVGTFGAVATVMRLPSLSTFKISIDPAWDYVAVTKWSQLELAAGFICLSLPSIRILVAMIIPPSFKELLSMNSSKSNSQSDRKSAPKSNNSNNSNQRKGSLNPSHWGNSSKITHTSIAESKKSSKTRGRFMNAIWPRPEIPKSPLPVHINHSRREGSSSSNMSVAKIAATSFPFREDSKQPEFEMAEVWQPRPSIRDSCRTCNEADDHLTALPHMGCIPERSYSQEDLIKEYHAMV